MSGYLPVKSLPLRDRSCTVRLFNCESAVTIQLQLVHPVGAFTQGLGSQMKQGLDERGLCFCHDPSENQSAAFRTTLVSRTCDYTLTGLTRHSIPAECSRRY